LVTLYALLGLSILVKYLLFMNGMIQQLTSFLNINFITVKSVKKVSPDTSLYKFDVPSQHEIPVSSYVLLRASVDGKEHTNPYTPVSQTDGELNLLIKSYPHGTLSKKIGELKAGDSINIQGPKPSRPYTPNEFKSIAFVAGGTGITPMLQIVQKILNNPADKTKLHLLFSNHTPEDILLRDELDALAAKHPGQFTVSYVVSKPPAAWKGYTGRVNPELVASNVVAKAPPSEKSLVYVSGPPGFMATVSGGKAKDYSQGELSGLLLAAGYNKAQVHKF